MIGPPPRRAIPVLVGVLAVLGVLGGPAAVSPAPPAAATPSEEPAPTPPHLTADVPAPGIRYQVSGTGIAGHITYQTTNGQQHVANVPLPWSTQLTGKMGNRAHPNAYAVSAQGVGPGSISCTLTINGQVVSQYTATGNPARVVCTSR